jgi:hypothetical protein
MDRNPHPLALHLVKSYPSKGSRHDGKWTQRQDRCSLSDFYLSSRDPGAEIQESSEILLWGLTAWIVPQHRHLSSGRRGEKEGIKPE